MVVLIQGHTYEVSGKMVNSLVELAREAVAGRNAIIALRKGEYMEFRRDIFENKETLTKQVGEYTKRGMIVYYVLGEES